MSTTRAELIEAAKAQISEFHDELLKLGVAETFDACTLAFLHDVLTGDGDALTTELTHRRKSAEVRCAVVPLQLQLRPLQPKPMNNDFCHD